MNSQPSRETWTESNHAVLALEIRQLCELLSGTPEQLDPDQRIASLKNSMAELPAIDHVAVAFGLSDFERNVLLCCAGIEMDSQLGKACTETTGRSEMTFALALKALPDPHWSALTRMRPLRRWRLIEVEAGPSLTAAALRIDERVLHYLAGINLTDHRLAPLLSIRAPARLMAREHERLSQEIAIVLERHTDTMPAVQLIGNDASGAEDVAAAAAARLKLGLHMIHAADLSSIDFETLMPLWEREAILQQSALLVQCESDIAPKRVAALGRRTPLFLASRQPQQIAGSILKYEVNKAEPREQQRLWQQALGDNGGSFNGPLGGVASHFRLSARDIASASAEVGDCVAAGVPADEALWRTCRVGARQRLDELAQRIPPGAVWDDIVLPQAQMTCLKQIAAQVRRRETVYDQWGFGRKLTRGGGISVLFCGSSGTGKTLAAEILASELRLDLYRIDLASAVSKYIGETEKNLRQIFDAADDSGAVLLFDEADALFGRRSEVKDSHDRYANLEVSYLLQRMETYRGLAILTTNLKSSIDSAFERRLRFVVQFPFPDAGQREAIWRLSVPAAAPSACLDFSRLAQLKVTGASARNIALNAAFLAADSDQPISMRHMLAAAQAESAKAERVIGHNEIRDWVE